MRVACVKRQARVVGCGGWWVVGRSQPTRKPQPPSSHCGVESLFPPAVAVVQMDLLAREWSSRDAASRRRRGARARRGNGRGVLLSHPTREGVVRHRRLAPADLVSSPALLRHSSGTLPAGPPARRVRPLARRRLRLRPPAADRGHAPRLVLALAADRLGARRGRRLLPRQHAAAHERRGARVAPQKKGGDTCVCARASRSLMSRHHSRTRNGRAPRAPRREGTNSLCGWRVRIARAAPPPLTPRSLTHEERRR